MPMHGDHKRIHLHAELADAVGIDPDDVFQRRERPAARDRRAAARASASREQSGMIFVDGVDIGDPADVALRDRRMLSADGIFIVVATVSEQNGESVAAARGDLPRRAVHRAGRRARRRTSATRSSARSRAPRSDGIREIDLLQQELHDDLAAFVYDRLRRRPMVLPVVVEV